MIKWILLSLIALHSTNVSAEIYKCTIDGVETYSQDPCADDAQLITVTPPTNIHSEKDTLSMDQLLNQCTNELKKSALFKDPDSVQVLSYKLDWISDSSGARRVLMMNINAKNGYGGYNGGEFFPCFLNYSGTKLSENQYLIKR